MSRVITFSTVFPSYHPKAGKQTLFPQKIWKGLGQNNLRIWSGTGDIYRNKPTRMKRGDWRIPIAWLAVYEMIEPKFHTIRAGHRWRVGDLFSPRIWSGLPYKSKQTTIGPDIEVKKTWDFDISGTDCALNGRLEYALTGEGFDFERVAKNDGLSDGDLYDWFTMSPDFKKSNEFHGQIICWNENIEY